MTHALLLRTVAAVSLLAAHATAVAADYCVGSVSEFQNALSQAEIDGADSVIKVRSGTYMLGNSLVYKPTLEWIIPAGKLTIRGGYNANCSAYSLTPGATTLNGSGQHLLFAETVTGGVSILGLTIVNGFLRVGHSPLSACPAPGPVFSFRRIRIDHGSMEVVALCHDVVIENTLLTNGVRIPGSTPWAADTALGVYLANNDDYPPASQLLMSSSTVSNGRVELLTCCDWTGLARLFNNVFDRAAGSEIFSQANILAFNNRYDGIVFQQGAVLVPGSNNNSSANPQLNAQYVPSAGSPMINSGTPNVPGGLPSTDLAGGERVVGAGVDRGALESPVDGTGVYVVSNANASGNGSLSWALELANAEAGSNTIRFNIPGTCPHRITLAAPLQVRDTLVVDGWSQPGHVANSSEFGWNGAPCVILDGAGTVAIGVEAMPEMASNGRRMTVRGLAFERFSLAIALAFGSDHAIYGNQFGGRVGGVGGPLLRGNTQAIGLIGSGRTRIGGWTTASRNLISGSSDVGVLITTFLGGGGNDNEVINNLIGLDKNGGSALANGTGIRVNGGRNRIIGNRIGGNSVDGILLSGQTAAGNRIQDNDIGGGLGALSFVIGNGRMGVMVQSNAHDNQIGPGNQIGRNGDDGVRIFTSAGGRNRITGNRIYRNAALGIDIGANGVSANNEDPAICDPDVGCAANRGQNFPVLISAERRRTGLIPIDRPIRVHGTLRSTLGGPYQIELFGGQSCEANGHGEGYRPLGSIQLTLTTTPYCPTPGGVCIVCNNLNCTGEFTLWLPEIDLAVGDVLTATATSAAGDTSEFSACRAVTEEKDDDTIFANGFQN